jgi:hypothetical protein
LYLSPKALFQAAGKVNNGSLSDNRQELANGGRKEKEKEEGGREKQEKVRKGRKKNRKGPGEERRKNGKEEK